MTISTLLLAVTFLKAQNTYVPDDNFEQALIALGYDSGDLNDSVPTANIEHILELDLNGKGINDLQGIGAFANITHLYCGDNSLTHLNLENNNELVLLNCENNSLEQLDLNSKVHLTHLY